MSSELEYSVWQVGNVLSDTDYANFRTYIGRCDETNAVRLCKIVRSFSYEMQSEQIMTDLIATLDGYEPKVAVLVAKQIHDVQYRLKSVERTRKAIERFERCKSAVAEMELPLVSLFTIVGTGMLCLYNDVQTMVNFFGDKLDTENFSDVEKIMNHIKAMAQDDKWEALAGKAIEYLKKDPTMVRERAQEIEKVAAMGYVDTLCYLTLKPLPMNVYEELDNYFRKPGVTLGDPSFYDTYRSIYDELTYIVEREKEFINQLPSETVAPLVIIMTELGKGRYEDLKSMEAVTFGYLAQAFSIAKANIDEATGKNYLIDFYSGVKGMLDTRPDKLGEWAKSICDNFASGKGLERWAQC